MGRLGFDLHGVLHPTDEQLKEWFPDMSIFIDGMEGARRVIIDLFKRYLEALGETREVWIVSGPPRLEVMEELGLLGYRRGVHYKEIASVVDFLKNEEVHMWQDDKKTWWASSEDWWGAKAKICEKYNINVMVDDQERYGPYFTGATRFLLWHKKNQEKLLNQKSLYVETSTENGDI